MNEAVSESFYKYMKKLERFEKWYRFFVQKNPKWKQIALKYGRIR